MSTRIGRRSFIVGGLCSVTPPLAAASGPSQQRFGRDSSMLDVDEVSKMLPYGSRTVRVEAGGMDTPKESGGVTVMANAAIIVFLDLPDGKKWGAPA